jgi:uncharacterized protein (TIGR00730 family)
MSSENMQSRLGARLAAEIHAANLALDPLEKGVCLFGGARVSPTSNAWRGAFEIARILASRGIPVLTGGGPGIMEAGNAGALAGMFGKSVGLNISLPFEQKPNNYQDVQVSFDHFASRKVCFVKFARGFVYFAGGFGTIDELGEVITLIQTGKMEQLPVILYDKAFWSGFIVWMRDVMLADGLITQKDLDRLILVDTPEEVVAALNLEVPAAVVA